MKDLSLCIKSPFTIKIISLDINIMNKHSLEFNKNYFVSEFHKLNNGETHVLIPIGQRERLVLFPKEYEVTDWMEGFVWASSLGKASQPLFEKEIKID